jgi:hypothetical protein
LPLGDLAENGDQECDGEFRGRQLQLARVPLRVADQRREPGGIDLPACLVEHLLLQVE